jgi:hypothetical protein
MKRCEDCKFYSNLERQCRKKLVTGLAGTPQGVQVVAGFPAVQPNWWCGEYEARLEALS